jgi:hypothetical protein
MSELTGSQVRRQPPTPPAAAADAVPSRRPRGRTRWLDALALAVIAATYSIVQYLVFPGPQRFDPSYYFQIGQQFPHVPANWWTLRIGLLEPIHLAIAVFGVSEAAQYAVPVAAALLLGGSVFATMRLLFRDRIVAVAAALVVLLNPDFLLNSAYIFPDTVATATFAAGFLLLIVARRKRLDPPRWTSTAAAAAAGVVLGWTYLIREFSPILLPAVIAAVLLFRLPLRRVLVLTGAAVATFSIELIYGAARYGNPFERIHVLLGRKRSSPSHHADWAPFRAQVKNIFDGLLVLPRLLLSWDDGWFLIALIVIFVIALLRFRGVRLLVLAAWLFSYWAVMAILAITHNATGDPILDVGNVRYWYPLLPALVMGGMGGLALLIRGTTTPSLRRVRLSQAAVLVAAALVLVPGTAQFSSCASKNVWRNDSAAGWDGVRLWLASPQAKQFTAIRSDRITERTLVEYTQTRFGRHVWHGVVGREATTHVPVPGPAGHSLLLVNVALTSHTLTDELLASWAPVYVSPDGRLAVLASKAVAQPVPAADEARWMASFGSRGIIPGRCGSSPYEAA